MAAKTNFAKVGKPVLFEIFLRRRAVPCCNPPPFPVKLECIFISNCGRRESSRLFVIFRKRGLDKQCFSAIYSRQTDRISLSFFAANNFTMPLQGARCVHG